MKARIRSQAIVKAFVFVAIVFSLQPEAQAKAALTKGCPYWMDAATGNPFPFPVRNVTHVSVAIRGVPQTYVLISGTWLNMRTKKPFPSPAGSASTDHASVAVRGVYRSYVLESCLPSNAVPSRERRH
jgi:hypothetical protein